MQHECIKLRQDTKFDDIISLQNQGLVCSFSPCYHHSYILDQTSYDT